MMMSSVKHESVVEDYDGHFYHHYDGNNTSLLASSPFFNPELSATQVKVEFDDDDMSMPSSVQPMIKEPKKRGRPKKVKDESGCSPDGDKNSSAKKIKADAPEGTKKRRNRFNGMPEEEVLLRLLPDRLAHDLDILIIGINPSLFAAYVGHHYAGPGNHFWKCLHLSGLIPEPMNAYDDVKLLEYGIGFTNICSRTTRGSADLKKQEIKEGAEILKKKLQEYKPKVAVFNGKGIYEVFSGSKNFNIGRQPDKIEGCETVFYVMPSSSARCAQLPRAMDKVPFYIGLKKLRDYMKGDLSTLEDSEVVFPSVPNHNSLPKPEVKDEIKILDEDDGSRSSTSKDLTLEQILMQTEYQEALMASAEGIDVSQEAWAQGQASFNTRRSVQNGDSIYKVPSSFPLQPSSSNHKAQPLTDKSASSISGTVVKQEFPFSSDVFDSVTVKGPSAQKVNLDPAIQDPYQACTTFSSAQYTSLGELPTRPKPAKKSAKESPYFRSAPSFPSTLSNTLMGRSPSPYQHSLLSQQHPLNKILHHSPFSHSDAGMMRMNQSQMGEKNVRNLYA